MSQFYGASTRRFVAEGESVACESTRNATPVLGVRLRQAATASGLSRYRTVLRIVSIQGILLDVFTLSTV